MRKLLLATLLLATLAAARNARFAKGDCLVSKDELDLPAKYQTTLRRIVNSTENHYIIQYVFGSEYSRALAVDKDFTDSYFIKTTGCPQ